MTAKRRLYMAAVNNKYGDQAYFPLTTGLMWAYARTFPEIDAAYKMCDMLYVKEPIETALARLVKPDVLALSSYIWNHEWNKAFARAVKDRYPSCVIIVGGVQVRDESPAVLEECEAFDFAIYGEGEGAFADFLREHVGLTVDLGNDCYALTDYAKVGSLVWKRWIPANDVQIVVNPRHALVDLEAIPSPYLTGVFDHIVATTPYKMMALQETNRGCAYRCSFCSWGAAALDKVRKFDEKRVVEEYLWFAQHQVELLYNCDANYGLFKRDIELTNVLARTKAVRGYPKLFRAAYAKNSNDTVFDISKTLADAGMLKATTLALQSQDEKVLVNIQRKNIKHDKFAELSARYEAAGIATYVELIVGLPGETYDSFVAGIDRILDAGQHDGLSIYLCMILENTEMAKPEYRAAHGIETVPMKALLYHGTPEPGVPEEVQETVVATTSMPLLELTKAVVYGWFVQALHSFGLTQLLAKELRAAGWKYGEFYNALLDWIFAQNRRSILGLVVDDVLGWWNAAKRGLTWPTVDARFGEVMWPPEELIFLRLAVESNRFYKELRTFLVDKLKLADDLVATSLAVDVIVQRQRENFIPPEPGKEAEYAREAVWYGRKGQGRKLRLRK